MTAWSINLLPSTLITSRDAKHGRVYRGGLINYRQAENNILRFAAYGEPITTMFDFYRLPVDFPGYADIDSINEDVDKVKHMESKMAEVVYEKVSAFRRDYFIPYIQLHEFEALFFSDLTKLKSYYLSDREQRGIDALIKETNGMMPEDIDRGEATAPARRLMDAMRYQKGSTVVYPLSDIGIDHMRRKCPHFNDWISRMIGIHSA